MKNVVFLSVILALCGAFSFRQYQINKSESLILLEPPLPPPPPIDKPLYFDDEFGEYEENVEYTVEKVKNGGSFKDLLTLFPRQELPFTLSANTLKEDFLALRKPKSKTEKRKIIPFDYEKYFPAIDDTEKFSRMPAPNGEPLASFETGDKFILIYFTRRGSYNYYAATFTKKGKFISEKHIAYASSSSIRDVILDTNLNIEQTTYEIVLNEENKNDYANRTIKELSFRGKKSECLLEKKTFKKSNKKDVVKVEP